MKIHKQHILVDLDCLLDTRFATLQDLNPVLAEKVLLDGSYHSRLTDYLGGFDYPAFVKRYKEYDINLLKKSVLTNMILLLKDLCLALQVESTKINVPMRYEIEVNCFPYEFTVEEQEEIRGCLEVHFPLPDTVVLINRNIKHLDVTYCKNTYSRMFMYRYHEWLDLHTEQLINNPCPGLILYAPAISFVENVSQEDKAIVEKEKIDPMKFLMLSLSPLLCLKLIDARIFSVISVPE